MSANDVIAVAPFAILVAGAFLVALLDRVLPADDRASRWLAAAIAGGAAASALIAGPGTDAFGGAIRRDASALFFVTLIALAAGAVLVLDASGPRARFGSSVAPVVLVLIGAAGGTLLAAAADLALMLVGFEMVFMSLLALVAREPSARARPASRALLVGGGTASSLFAFGVALLWWSAETSAIGALSGTSPAALVGVALLLVALATLAAMAPLHGWLITTVVALPAPSALFVATVPRIAALAALLRCAGAITSSGTIEWRASVAILAAVTLVIGSIAAISETSLRKAAAFLSVAYVGQVGVAAAAGGAGAAIAFALGAFVPLLVGLFAVLASLAAEDPSVEELRGLARRRPLLVASLGVMLFGLAGIPPTAGFFARLAIFESAVDAQLAWLMFVAALATVAMAAAAARITFVCLDPGPGVAPRSRVPALIAGICALLVLAGGIVPGPLLDLARGVRF